MMGLVPRRVGHDAGPVGSRALERPYRDRPASWRLVSSRRARIMADDGVSWFAGVDWGSERHQVCLLDAAGQVVGERGFRHDGAGLAALCDWLVCRSRASQAGSRWPLKCRTGRWWMLSWTAALPCTRSEEHTSELQSRGHLVCRLLLEKKKRPTSPPTRTRKKSIDSII